MDASFEILHTLLIFHLLSAHFVTTIKRGNFASCVGICLKRPLLKNNRNATLGRIRNCSRVNQDWYVALLFRNIHARRVSNVYTVLCCAYFPRGYTEK
jgi:hypothetical protein